MAPPSEDYYRHGYWEAQLHRAADEGAEKAVDRMFAMLGVDVNDPQQVEALREDIRLARRLRSAFDRSLAWGLTALVMMLGSFVVIAVHARWGKLVGRATGGEG